MSGTCLNPCCSGSWSVTHLQSMLLSYEKKGLNPCCSGSWSVTEFKEANKITSLVLILVVVEVGL